MTEAIICKSEKIPTPVPVWKSEIQWLLKVLLRKSVFMLVS